MSDYNEVEARPTEDKTSYSIGWNDGYDAAIAQNLRGTDWQPTMIGVSGGHLMYRMGSQNISCNCIGEPFSSEISERFGTILKAAETVLATFEKDEAQGYRSKDRQFAIEMLSKSLR